MKAQLCVEAEAWVAEALQRQGWRIIARNFRHTGFELDLVAAKQDTVIVVEVKARRQRLASERDVAQLLPRKKRDSLLRGAAALDSRFKLSYTTLRIDLAIVYRDEHARPRIDYYVNALPAY